MLMKLGLTYHTAFDFRRARQAYEEGFALWQRTASMKLAVPPPPAPHALRTHWEDPATLDPGHTEDLASADLIRKLFSGLVGLTPEMDLVPDVARTWEVLDGGCRYLFHLRDDVRWSDGLPVTAHDFEYAWKRALDPATGSTFANLLYDVKGAKAFHHGEVPHPDRVGVRALDESTLAVDLEEPTGYFLYLLAYCVSHPVPRHAVEMLGEDWTEVGNIVTNGPFRLEAWRPGEFMVLSRYPGYHGRFGGNVQRVELTLLPAVRETPAALEMYEADELDILDLMSLPPTEMDSARQGHPGEYVRVPRLSTSYVGFDLRRPPFNDVRVRRAFALAIDRETLADVVLRGYVLPAAGGFVPPGIPGYSAGIGLPYDPEQARQLLAQAGYPGGCGFPVVDWLVANVRIPCAEYLQTQWRENLGVEISWEPWVAADVLQSQPPHMLTAGWIADYPDPDNFLRASIVPWWIGWGNEACERLVEKARRVTDQAERMKLYAQAERILVREARIIPLTYDASHWLAKPWVTRYPTSAMSTYFWKDVIIEPH
jgi:ABC-type oligopeptide transport system substrate-binding subunit